MVSTTCNPEFQSLFLTQCSEFTGGLLTAVTCRNGPGSNLNIQYLHLLDIGFVLMFRSLQHQVPIHVSLLIIKELNLC